MDDRETMRQALIQAHMVEGRTATCPPVGAVIVRDGAIVGRGATSSAPGWQGIMHVLLEGDAKLPGSAFDCAQINHVAAFIAPKLIGRADAPSPLQGLGIAQMCDAIPLHQIRSRIMDKDLLVEGELFH